MIRKQNQQPFFKNPIHRVSFRLQNRNAVESVPGTAVEHFAETEDEVAFTVSAKEDAQFTLELEPDCEYIVYVDDVNIGKMMTNLSGKLSVSAELQEGVNAKIRVARV